MLTERYPATFRHEGEPPRPLAIGTGDRLIAERALDPALVHTAMRLYTGYVRDTCICHAWHIHVRTKQLADSLYKTPPEPPLMSCV